MIGSILRFKTAVALVLLGLLTLLAGIGQKTFWAPPETITATAPTGTAAPLTVFDEKLKTLHPGTVKIHVKGEGAFLLAAGRPDDVDAWVGKTAHNTVAGVSEDGKALQLTHTDGEATAPSPAGSDLWVTTENATGEMDYSWNAPADGDWSLLLAADGTKPAPGSITMTFPNDTSTPWAIPLMVLGGLLIIAGGALLVLKPKSGNRRPAAAAAAAAVRPPRAGQGRGTPRGQRLDGKHPGSCRTRHRSTASTETAPQPATPEKTGPEKTSAGESSGRPEEGLRHGAPFRHRRGSADRRRRRRNVSGRPGQPDARAVAQRRGLQCSRLRCPGLRRATPAVRARPAMRRCCWTPSSAASWSRLPVPSMQETLPRTPPSWRRAWPSPSSRCARRTTRSARRSAPTRPACLSAPPSC